MTGQESASLVANNAVKIIPSEDKNDADVKVEEQNAKKDRGKPLRQIIAAFIANLGTVNTGLVFGFSAVACPQLEHNDLNFLINKSQSTWIASLSSASTPFGCILSGYLMDRIGRKRTLLLTEIPMIIGWILIASATNVYWIYAGRLLTGLGSGMVGAPSRVYTSEVTQPHLRGMLAALASVSISFGVLLQYSMGSYLHWRVISGVSACIPIFAFALMILMPETPNYLVARSKPEQAIKSLAKLRGSSYNLNKEIESMQQYMEQNNAQRSTSFKETLTSILSPTALKPFAILVIYFMMYQFSGVNALTFYAVEIFEETGTKMDKHFCTIVLAIVRLVFTIVGCISLRKCGRRPLTFISSIGCGVSMVLLGTYLYFKNQWAWSDPPVKAVATWFPVLCIFVFQAACTMGFLIVPWVMIGEIYPQKVRGILGGFTTCSAHMFIFIVVKTYEFLKHALYDHGTYTLYGCISLIGSIFLYFYLPETKGKTLQEIEDYFAGRTKTLNNSKEKNNLSTIPEIVIEKDKLLA